MTEAAPPPGEPPRDDAQPELAARVERLLLGGERRYTRAGVAGLTGIAAEHARELWQALGFAAVADDEPVFTDADIAALRGEQRLSEQITLDDEQRRAIARMLGRSFARLAAWQGEVLAEAIAHAPGPVGSDDDVVAMLEQVVAELDGLQSYVWRRQLAAYVARVASGAAHPGEATTMTVGFADMAQFTALTRRWSEAELGTVLDAFEAAATTIIGAEHGQVVKTIGDEVLFVVDTVRSGAEIALRLVETAESSPVLPALRVGLASGPVVNRLGDVFGETVNIASRLTSLARATSVLVDDNVARELDADPGYATRALRPATVRGYHHLRAWRLRRAPG